MEKQRGERFTVAVVVLVLVLLGGGWWAVEHPRVPPPPEQPPAPRGPGGAAELDLEESDMIFGETVELTAAAGAASDIIGTVFPFPEGAPTKSVYAIGAWPTWPNPATLVDEAVAHCFTIHCSYDSANRARCIRGYLEYPTGDGPDTDTLRAAIYRASDGALIGGTEPVVINEGDSPAWYEFDLIGEGPVLVAETEYALVVWGNNPSTMDTGLWGGDLEDYLPPVVISCSDLIVLGDAIEVHDVGVGISAQDQIVIGERLRHGGLIAPCTGRYIPPEPEEHGANPHRWDGKGEA